MRNVFKKIFKWFLIFVLFIVLVFWLWYLFKINRDLVIYNIPEKLVVKFEEDSNNYLVNLNDGSYSKYDWVYSNYWYDFKLSTWYETTKRDMEIFNRKIYNQNNIEVYRYINSWFKEAYWSQDWKYVISRNWYIVRMFWLFLSIETANPVITIVEASTWRMKQLILWKPWDKFINIEKILWYVN